MTQGAPDHLYTNGYFQELHKENNITTSTQNDRVHQHHQQQEQQQQYEQLRQEEARLRTTNHTDQALDLTISNNQLDQQLVLPLVNSDRQLHTQHYSRYRTDNSGSGDMMHFDDSFTLHSNGGLRK